MLPKLPTIEEAGRLMRQKELTPLDLVEHCLGRIAQFEDCIHAWVLVDEEGARKEAREIGRWIGKDDDSRPLLGIPLGIKDIIDVKGMPTKCGSRVRENTPPGERDSGIVAALRDEGAIILGKTVTTDYASFDPPPTRNPWSLNHTPGGSSSGSAAAIAAEMCMAAIGTQTGGSIIRPAAYCGVVGFKPYCWETFFDGIYPFTLHLDHVGPMARTVKDTELVTLAFYNIKPPPPRNSAFSPFHLATFIEPLREQCSSEVWAMFQVAVERLAAANARIIEVGSPPGYDKLHTMHRRIMAAEVATLHREQFPANRDLYSPIIRGLIEEGLALSATDYAEALMHRNTHQPQVERWMSRDDRRPIHGVLMPATPTTAPSASTTGDPKFNSPWSYFGFPAITLPIGLARDGLPVGIQIVSVNTADLFEIGAFCEKHLDGVGHPPLLNEPT